MEKQFVESIIPFDMIIDPEMGLMKLIEFEYRNKIFNLSALGTDDFTKIYLRQRIIKNPLSIIIQDESITIDDMNDLYNQFFDQRYEDILELSPNTGLFRLLQLSYRSESLRFTVICENKEQEELFLKRGGKAYRVVVGSLFQEEFLEEFSNFYIKYVEQLERQKNDIEKKNIYFVDYEFNMIKTNKGTVPSFLPQNIDRFRLNMFNFINLYPIDKNRLERLCGEKINFKNVEDEEDE